MDDGTELVPLTPKAGVLSEETKICLQFAKEASARARSMILLLTTFSILTFIAWWNHYENAWPRTRLRYAQAAVHYLCTQQANDTTAGQQKEPDKDCDNARAEQYFRDKNDERQNAKLKNTMKAGEALSKRMKFTLPQAKAHLQLLQQQYVGGVTKITIPFLGIQADVNDLGVFAGISLVTLLSLFCFAVWREEHNLRYLFAVARKNEELPTVYGLFAMTQVFTIPPHEKNGLGSKATARFFYWMTAIALGLVAGYDIFMTIKDPDEFATVLDYFTLTVEAVVLTVILIQRWIISHLANRIDEQWKTAFEEVKGQFSSSQSGKAVAAPASFGL